MPQATSFDTLLTQCRDLICERLSAALAAMLDKADDALLAMVAEARDQDTRKLYLETRDKVLAQRETIETQFRARYLREFQQRSNRVKKIGDSFAEIDLSSLELELVGEDDLNETLKFNAMATRLRQFCDEELIALDQRVGVLLGDASLQAEDNPFTPQAICDAYKHTCRQVDSEVDVRMVLLKLFDDHVVDELRAVYKAVNALLVQNSILPKIRLAAQRQGGKAPPSGARGESAQAADRTAGGEQDIFSVLQKLLTAPKAPMGPAGGPGAPAQGVAASGFASTAGASGMGADAGQAILQGAELLRSLTRIQLGDASAATAAGLPLATDIAQLGTTNVLRELKGSKLGTGMNQMDTMTLDIMAMLFDQLFDDPKIPVGVKGLIGRLQIPMLKVAIADKAFFSKKTHPARQMLDTLGEISTRLPADFSASNPLYGRLEAILHELMDGFEDNIEIFDLVRERLQALIAEEDHRIEQETQSSAKQVEQKENLAVAKTVAQAEIKVRIRGARIPLPVLKYLIQEWVKLLIVVHVKSGENSDDWKNALKTIDLLISSIEPRETAEERRQLMTMLPDLLRRLAAGSQLAGVEDDVRARFFTDLRKLHSEILGKATAENGAAAAQSVAIPEAAVPAPPAPAEGLAPVEPSPEPSVTTEVRPDSESAQPAAESSGEMRPALELPDLPFTPTREIQPVSELPDLTAAPTEAGSLIEQPPDEAPPPSETPPLLPDLPFTLAEATPPVPPAPHSTPSPADEAALLPDLSFLTRTETAPSAPASPPRQDAVRQVVQPGPVVPPKASSPREAAEPLPGAAAPTASAAPPQTSPPRPPAGGKAAPVAPESTPRPPAPRQAAPTVQAPPRAAAPPREAARPVAASPVKPTAPTRTPATASVPGSMDFTAAVTVNNPFGEGKVEVDDLDFTVKPAAGDARAKPEAAVAQLPSELKEGTWVEIVSKSGKGTRALAKLSYITPLKTRYLFVDRNGKTVLECSRAELARKFELAEIAVTKEVSEAPLFDRIVGDLVSKLAGTSSSR